MGILEFLDNSGTTMVKRLPDDGQYEIVWGSQLIVRESQSVVFFRDGRSLDIFGPGRYVLQTQNLPVLTKFVTSLGYGSQSPFKSEVYFLNMKLFSNLKWGTKESDSFQGFRITNDKTPFTWNIFNSNNGFFTFPQQSRRNSGIILRYRY